MYVFFLGLNIKENLPCKCFAIPLYPTLDQGVGGDSRLVGFPLGLGLLVKLLFACSYSLISYHFLP